MTDDGKSPGSPGTVPAGPGRTGGWREGDIPGWLLMAGLVVFVVLGLALASAGGTGGIVAVAFVEAAAVALLYRWCVAPAPGRSARQD